MLWGRSAVSAVGAERGRACLQSGRSSSWKIDTPRRLCLCVRPRKVEECSSLGEKRDQCLTAWPGLAWNSQSFGWICAKLVVTHIIVSVAVGVGWGRIATGVYVDVTHGSGELGRREPAHWTLTLVAGVHWWTL